MAHDYLVPVRSAKHPTCHFLRSARQHPVHPSPDKPKSCWTMDLFVDELVNIVDELVNIVDQAGINSQYDIL